MKKNNIIQIIASGVILFLFLAFIIWFSVAILMFIFIASACLTVYIFLRGKYLRWKHKDFFTQSKHTPQRTQTSIIDVEYHEISNINKEPKD